MKAKIFTLLFSLLALVAYAQTPHTIWGNVQTGFNSHSHVVNITKVKMGDERTEVTMHIDYRPGEWIRMKATSYLQVGSERYPIRKNMPIWAEVGTTLIELDQQFVMPESGQVDFVCVFDALPKGTTHFDLIEPAGWQFFNIHPGNVLPQGLTDTYWRNEATGEWLIGFAEHHIIYNNCVWDILSQTEKKDSYTFVASKGKEKLSVSVSKMKKGMRKIGIGENRAIACRPITTGTLPDYPSRDLRRDFKDNGYQAGDSATIMGWIKDIPASVKGNGGNNSLEVFIENFISDEQETFNTSLDSLGRFCIKVPLLNTSYIFMSGLNRSINTHTILEPGETYFYLYDCKTGHELFMGKDARLQNELLAHVLYLNFPTLQNDHSTAEEAMAYLEEGKRELAATNAKLDSTLLAHPTLSLRFEEFLRNNFLVDLGRNLMQARYYVDKFQLPKGYVDYVSQNLWLQHGKPYTLHREFSTFMRDYIDVRNADRKSSKTSLLPMIQEMAEQGKISLNEKEASALGRFEAEIELLNSNIDATEDKTQKQALIDAFNNSELVAILNGLFSKYQYDISTELLRRKLKHGLDSVASDKTLYELYIARELYDYIDDNRRALPAHMVEWMKSELKTTGFIQQVLAQNEKYEALSRRDISGSSSLRSAEDVSQLSDGEKILQKIIEPHQGKLILIDVWGTWCGPCKAALKHSQELYQRMQPHDMVFIYLANRSDKSSWENVIKENNVLGENVIHYNLPAEQQRAVELHLKVPHYPSYFLFDRNGQRLDINADPRDLNRFEELVKSIH
ncbi:MAG: redoxin domain-containing protein [Bacteroidaceae bacterium]|nr:redoxin domain-containing protein [Bacteroidaceae bacterium]